MLLGSTINTESVRFPQLGNVTVLSTGGGELEQILEEGDELILSLAVGEKEREENGEIAGLDKDLLSYLLGELLGYSGVLGEVGE